MRSTGARQAPARLRIRRSKSFWYRNADIGFDLVQGFGGSRRPQPAAPRRRRTPAPQGQPLTPTPPLEVRPVRRRPTCDRGHRHRRHGDRPGEAQVLAVGLPALRHGGQAASSSSWWRWRAAASSASSSARCATGSSARRPAAGSSPSTSTRRRGSAAWARGCSQAISASFRARRRAQAAHHAGARQHADPVVLPQPGHDGRAADPAGDGP